jgi:predicted Fe-Mo cluster-binding NifX family protein
MHSQLIIVLLIGLAASTYALDLSHANKRSLETEPRLLGILNDFYAQIVYPPLNHIVTNLALLSAQFLAGVAENGIRAPGGRTLHPSDVELRGFFDNLWNNAVKPPIEQALSGLSLLAAQLLAGIGSNGVDLSSIGKRDLTEAESRAFGDALFDALNSVFTSVIQKPLEDALAGGALMLAQVLAGLGTNGINLSNIVGKRDLTALAGRQAELRGFFDSLGQNLLNGLQSVWTNVVQNPLEQALQTSALLAAQVLAGMGTNGIDLSTIGKRDLTPEPRGPVIDALTGHASGLVGTQVKPAIENALNAAALHLASVLANFAQNGIGRR